MIGAIVGDIAGSRFEFDTHKGKDFTLLVTPGDISVRTSHGDDERAIRIG